MRHAEEPVVERETPVNPVLVRDGGVGGGSLVPLMSRTGIGTTRRVGRTRPTTPNVVCGSCDGLCDVGCRCCGGYAAEEYCSGTLHDLKDCCCFAVFKNCCCFAAAVVCLISTSIYSRSGSDPAMKRHRTYHKPHGVKTLQSEATLHGHLQATSNDLITVGQSR